MDIVQTNSTECFAHLRKSLDDMGRHLDLVEKFIALGPALAEFVAKVQAPAQLPAEAPQAAAPAKKGARKQAAGPATATPATAPAQKKGKSAKTAKAAKTDSSEKKAAPAKKTKAAAAAKTTGEAKPGRVVDDSRVPTLTERLKTVVGEAELSIDEVIAGLQGRGTSWVPNSKNLKSYISMALSSHAETFERLSRGRYRIRKAGSPVPTPQKAGKKAVTAQKTNGAQNPSNGAAGVEDLGTDVMDSPFTGAAA